MKSRLISGNEFEQMALTILQKAGWWAVRLNPDRFGSQPFDILAINGSKIRALDCKVISTETHRFSFSRIEQNQRSAMEYFEKRTNGKAGFLILRDGIIYLVPYEKTKNGKSSNLDEEYIIYDRTM